MKRTSFLVLCSLLIGVPVTAQVSVTVKGASVTVHDMNFTWACGGLFEPVVNIAADTVTIVERDTMPLTNCVCNHSVVTTVNGLPPGNHVVMLYREHRYHFYVPVDTVWTSTIFVGAYPFIITGGSVLPALWTSVTQAGCGISPRAVDGGSMQVQTGVTLDVHPNPFNAETIISYRLETEAEVKVSIADALGREAAVIASGWQAAGVHSVRWDASRFTSGVYFACLLSGGKRSERKIVLTK